MGVCNCSLFCCMLLYVRSSIAIILMGKRELVALLNLSYWCIVMVERLFLAVPRGCLWFVNVVFSDHTHLLFLCISMLYELELLYTFGRIAFYYQFYNIFFYQMIIMWKSGTDQNFLIIVNSL